jgi:mRNA interferase MazF
MTRKPKPRRGEIWLVNLDPTVGEEIQKTRPVIVVSTDDLGVLEIKLVVPITGWKEHFEGKLWHMKITPDGENGLDKPSSAEILHMRSVSYKRFVRRTGVVPNELLKEIAAMIAVIIELKI